MPAFVVHHSESREILIHGAGAERDLPRVDTGEIPKGHEVAIVPHSVLGILTAPEHRGKKHFLFPTRWGHGWAEHLADIGELHDLIEGERVQREPHKIVSVTMPIAPEPESTYQDPLLEEMKAMRAEMTLMREMMERMTIAMEKF